MAKKTTTKKQELAEAVADMEVEVRDAEVNGKRADNPGASGYRVILDRLRKLERAAAGAKKPRKPKPADYVCVSCGSDDVEHAAWVNPNTKEVGEDFGTWNQEDAVFCNGCDGHEGLITRADYEAGR